MRIPFVHSILERLGTFYGEATPWTFQHKLQFKSSLQHRHIMSYCTTLAAHTLRDFMLEIFITPLCATS